MHHYASVLVVCIDDCYGFFSERIKEEFLAAYVLGKSLVIVEMVVGEVREDSCSKLQSGCPLLFQTYGTDFHEAVLASGLRHLGEQGIDGDGVRCGVGGFAALCPYIICYCREQSALVSEAAEHVVKQGYRGGFAVGAGNAHQLKFSGRMSEEIISAESEAPAVGIYYGTCAFCDCVLDEGVSVGIAALYCNEQGPGACLARITRNRENLGPGCSMHYGCSCIIYDLFEFHFLFASFLKRGSLA